jgi:phosphoribosylformimino-5-aminoimidazole carboxamide ribotide isomerase
MVGGLMRIVAVIDVQNGRAVHARGGDRGTYAPVDRAAGVQVGGDAVALARVYVETLGLQELYVADLDAIRKGIAALNFDLIASIVALGRPVWLDAGLSRLDDTRTALGTGASTAIVGLETLGSFDALREISATVSGRRVAFSLDLRDGIPIAMPNVVDPAWTPADIAAEAADAGAGAIVLLDLARVGMGAGVDVPLLASLRRAVPNTELFAGGGVRSASDLAELSSVGCDGALVATALLSGAIKV